MAQGLQHIISIVNSGDSVLVKGDSQMAINMMQGKYKPCTAKLYWPQYDRCKELVQILHGLNVCVEFEWIPREQNTECDELSKLPASKPVSADLLAEAEDLLL